MKIIPIVVFVLVSFLLVTPVSPLFAQATGDVSLVGSLNPRPGGYSSCWGYVTPDGREYALLGTRSGTSIININSLPLREVKFISGPSSGWREMKTWSHYAYVVTEGGGGVQIIDLTNPDSARLVRSFTYSSGGRNINRSHTITIADGYMYLNGSAGWSPGGVLIFSLAIPDSPLFVGQFQPEYIHDSYVRYDTMYAAAIYGGGCYVVNIQDKANPQLIRRIEYTDAGTHNTWASINGGRYVFTTDEINHPRKNLKVWDIDSLGSRPHTPVVEYTASNISPLEIIHNVHGRGNYLYIAYYTAGVRVVDVHNPRNPVEVGAYDTYPGPPPNPPYAGVWGVYPYFPSGRWIGSDMQTGLYLFSFTGLQPRSRSPLLLPANGDTVGQAGSISFRWRAAADRAADPHYYQIHLFGSGLDTLIRSDDTTFTLSDVSSLVSGQTYRWHVWILDEYTQVSSQDTFRFTVVAPPVSVDDRHQLPSDTFLEQNYPNPFNPVTTIGFGIAHAGYVSLRIFDLLGREVVRLADEELPAGRHERTFEAAALPGGVYFCRLSTASHVETRKLVLLK